MLKNTLCKLSNLSTEQMDEQEKMLSNARKRFITEEIDAEDFRVIIGECNEALKILEAKLADLPLI